MNHFFFSKHFLKKSIPSSSLGALLQAARLEKELSISEAADAIQLKESVLVLLEADEFFDSFQIEKKSTVRNIASARLIAVRYARSLGLSLEEIRYTLPGLPSLSRPGITYLKNLSEVSPKQSFFWKRQTPPLHARRVHVSSHTVNLGSFLKLLIILGVLILLFYAWSDLRHLNRVIWSHHGG